MQIEGTMGAENSCRARLPLFTGQFLILLNNLSDVFPFYLLNLDGKALYNGIAK